MLGQVVACSLILALGSACGGSPAISVGTGAVSNLPAPTAGAELAVARANAAVQEAAATLAMATGRLAGDFAWTKTAFPSGTLPSNLSTATLYSSQIAAIGAGSAHGNLQRARAAAKSQPPDCPAVFSGKAAIAAQASRSQATLAAVQALTKSALDSLQRATADRTVVTAALAHLEAVIHANPAATVDPDVQRRLATSYPVQEQQQLTDAVLRAQASAVRAATSVQATATAAAAVGTICH